jgi:signal transduction histidine kinase
METDAIFRRYRELQAYVGWTDADAARVAAIGPILAPHFPALVDDFYAEIERHEEARRVIRGGPPQIERLKGTLSGWLVELFSGRYDEAYVERRWRVGWRHVEIGLAQVYTNASLSRLRGGLLRALRESWSGSEADLAEISQSLDRLIDLDLAIIEEAYNAEFSARLQRSERLATLGQISGGIAHELRNPLNVVKTSVYYLKHARNASPAKQVEHLDRIERQVESADRVITALASFAKMPAPKLAPVDIAGCLRETLTAEPPAETIAVEWDVPEDLPRGRGDRDQLVIVFGNLIRNACDAMPGGGRLTLSARAADGRLSVEVRDTGVGIDAEQIGRIMEPLYSTKARGLGLGLAIARAILERVQGRLRVASEVGRGSSFVAELPAAGASGESAP